MVFASLLCEHLSLLGSQRVDIMSAIAVHSKFVRLVLTFAHSVGTVNEFALLVSHKL